MFRGGFAPNHRVETLRLLDGVALGAFDSPLDSHAGGCKDGGKSKCGKGHTNCSPQNPPVGADDLGYCQELNGNGAPVAGKTCYQGKGYDQAECCGTSGTHCNKPNSEWHWCEKSDPIDPCEGFCSVWKSNTGAPRHRRDVPP